MIENICVAGRNNIAVNVLISLLKNFPRSQYKYYVIHGKNDLGKDGFQRSLKKYAIENNICIINLEEAYIIPNLLFLSIEFDRIIKPNKFASNNLYNIHFSLLPAYKGMYTSALPILNGEKYSGVTFHKIDAGIDTGDIISQNKFELNDSYTAKKLYNTYSLLGHDIVIECVRKILNDDYNTMVQSSEGSTYFSKATIDYKNLNINLSATALQINRQLRAFNYREFQLPAYNGSKIIGSIITSTKSSHRSGSLLFEDNMGFLLSTIDYDIYLIKDKFEQYLNDISRNDCASIFKDPYIKMYIDEQNYPNGWTLLMAAAYHGNLELVKYLTNIGFNVNACNYNGTTVLMYAKDGVLRGGNTELLNFLLQNGADINALDYKGNDIMYYVSRQSKQIYSFLTELKSQL